MANMQALTVVSTGAASTVPVNGGSVAWADGLVFQADPGNTGHVRVGPVGGVSATEGVDLAPGAMVNPFHTERANVNLGSIAVYFANAADKLQIVYFQE